MPSSRPRAARRGVPVVFALTVLLACGESLTEPVATSLTIEPRNFLLQGLDETATLVAEVRDQFGELMTGATVVWSSSDATIVTVNAQGKVAAVGYGEALIYAAHEAARGAAAVTVTRPIGSVVVSPAQDTVSLGESVRFTAHALYDNGDSLPGAEFVWKTSDPVVAGIEAGTGLVSGNREGRATITATIADKEGSAGIMVVSPDRDALVALYQATDGDNWVSNTRWLTDAPVGQWSGVRGVDENARVTDLWLAENNLTGPIPRELGEMSELRQLILHENSLMGRIPSELGSLHQLRVLYLQENDFSGPVPTTLGGLFNVQQLYLSWNNLTGRIPGSFRGLRSLNTLSLAYNDLTGPLPLEILGLPELTWLRLSGNDLSGPIPPEIGNLPKLYELGLSGNDFTGPIPPELGNLTNLWTLELDRNNFSGPIPPELARLNPASLRLCCNNLTGAIPAGIGDMSNLWRLDLGGNDLTGPIPPELGRLLSLDGLSLEGNNLQGSVPGELGNLKSITALVLSSNPGIGGALPLSLTSLKLLTTFSVDGTGVCAPPDPAFTAWLAGITRKSRVDECTAP